MEYFYYVCLWLTKLIYWNSHFYKLILSSSCCSVEIFSQTATQAEIYKVAFYFYFLCYLICTIFGFCNTSFVLSRTCLNTDLWLYSIVPFFSFIFFCNVFILDQICFFYIYVSLFFVQIECKTEPACIEKSFFLIICNQFHHSGHRCCGNRKIFRCHFSDSWHQRKWGWSKKVSFQFLSCSASFSGFCSSVNLPVFFVIVTLIITKISALWLWFWIFSLF